MVLGEGLGPLHGLVPHNATGLGSHSPPFISAAPESFQNQKHVAWGLASPLCKQKTGQGMWLAAGGGGDSVLDDMPFAPTGHPSSDPPAFPSLDALLMAMTRLSCQGPWNVCLKGLLSELDLSVEAGWAYLPRGLLMTGETCPHGHYPHPP